MTKLKLESHSGVQQARRSHSEAGQVHGDVRPPPGHAPGNQGCGKFVRWLRGRGQTIDVENIEYRKFPTFREDNKLKTSLNICTIGARNLEHSVRT